MTKYLARILLALILSISLIGPIRPNLQATVNACDPCRNDYTGNGSTTGFTYSFRITDKTHLEVLLDGTVKNVDTDYTVSGVDAATGGTVTFTIAPASGVKVTLLRKQPASQQSDYITGEGFPSGRVEKDLDKLVMGHQQQAEQLNRSLHIPKKSTLTGNQTEIDVQACSDKFLKANAAGTGLECQSFTSAGSIGIPVSPAQGGTGTDMTTGFTKAGLPAAGTAGRLARVTDDNNRLYLDDGTAWRPVAPEAIQQFRRKVPLLEQTVGSKGLPITVGTKPRGLTFDGTHLWVSNYDGGLGPNTVSKIDVSTNTVVATVTVGRWPFGSAFDGTNVWVANNNDNNVSKIDIDTNTVVATVAVGTQPRGVAFDGTYIWVTNFTASSTAGSVSKINITTNTVVATITNANIIAPYGIAFDGTHVWVANFGAGLVAGTDTVSKINVSTNAVDATVNITSIVNPGVDFPAPVGVAFDGAFIWITGYANGEVQKINRTTNAVVAKINIGPAPEFLAFDGKYLWVPVNGATPPTDSDISQIDVNANVLLKRHTTGINLPFAIAFDGTYIWASNFNAANVTKIFPTSAVQETNIKIGTFTIDTSTIVSGTTKTTVTGLGFKPTNVMFLVSEPSTAEASIGWSGASNENLAILNDHLVTANTWTRTDTKSIFLSQSSTINASARIIQADDYTSDGFILTWDKTGAPTGTATIYWLAISAFTP